MGAAFGALEAGLGKVLGDDAPKTFKKLITRAAVTHVTPSFRSVPSLGVFRKSDSPAAWIRILFWYLNNMLLISGLKKAPGRATSGIILFWIVSCLDRQLNDDLFFPQLTTHEKNADAPKWPIHYFMRSFRQISFKNRDFIR